MRYSKVIIYPPWYVWTGNPDDDWGDDDTFTPRTLYTPEQLEYFDSGQRSKRNDDDA